MYCVTALHSERGTELCATWIVAFCSVQTNCRISHSQIPGIIFELAAIWNVWERGTVLFVNEWNFLWISYWVCSNGWKRIFFARIDSLVAGSWWWWLKYWKPPRVSNHFLNMFSIFIALEFEFQLSTEHIFEICAIDGIMRKTDCNWIALGGLKWNRSLLSGYFVTQNSLGRICLGT